VTENITLQAVQAEASERDDTIVPMVHDSFSVTSASAQKSQLAGSHDYAQILPDNSRRPSTFEIIQLPKGIYVMSFLGLLAAVINMVTTFDTLRFIGALCSIAVFIGLLLRFNFARQIALGFAMLSIILSLIVLVNLNHLRSLEANSYAQQQQSISSNADIGIMSADVEQFSNTGVTEQHTANLRTLQQLKTISIATIIINGIEAVYLLSPRVKAAFRS
jgi:hypothetical protein